MRVKVLQRGEAVQGKMRSVGVIFENGLLELGLEGCYIFGLDIGSAIKLLPEGSVASFNATIILRPLGRQNIKADI